MKEVIRHLDSATGRARRLLIGRRVAVLVTAWVVVVVLMITMDWIVRFSTGARFTVFIVLATGIAISIAWWLVPALAFRPSRHRLALRLEKLEPDLRGRLASSIEFESTGLVEKNPLAAASVEETRQRLHGISVESMINPKPAWFALTTMLVLMLACISWIILDPGFTRLGLTRVFAPWSSVQWPPRTAVASRMHQVVPDHHVHGQGIPLLLRAENLTSNQVSDPVEAMYRIIDEGYPSEWTTVLLTHQRDGIHERLISTSGEAIEVTFSTSDAQTPIDRILLMPLPKVDDVALTIEPPAHARPWKDLRHVQSSGTSSRLDLIRPPVLEGSNLQLDVHVNRSISIPGEGQARSDWISQTFGLNQTDGIPELTVDQDDPRHWMLTWQADSPRRMLISIQDEFGLESVEPVPIHIPVEEDRPPDVVLLEPEQDLDVLASATIPLVAEAVDNLPLRTVGITVIRGEDDQIAGEEQDATSERSRIQSPLDVSSSGAVEGDVLQVRGIASDQWRDDLGEYRESQSRVRMLRVVSETEFLSQLRDQLSLLEQRSMDLESSQQDIQEQYKQEIQKQAAEQANSNSTSGQDVSSDSNQGRDQRSQQALERRQADVSRRINDQRNQVGAVQDWLDANALNDERIESVLDQVDEALSDAEQSSSEAMQSMESSRESQASSESGDVENNQSASDQVQDAMNSQQEVREALQDVVSALAEDQESWLLSRKMENIESRQQSLQDQTRSLAEQTRGQRMEELPSEVQSAIEDVAREQDSLVESVSELSESMKAHAEAIQEMDPSEAMTMQRAAEMVEEQDLESLMSEAADEIEDGRLEMAGGSQQEVMEALRSIQEAMSPDRRDRIADLLRRLVDLEKAIQQLVEFQGQELVELEDAIASSDYSNRDRAMIDIRKRTLAVSDEARNRSEEERGISRRLERAGDSQSDAITVLRFNPIDGAVARSHELTALQQLEAALEDLARLEEQAQQEMTEADRESLAEAYRELGQKQIDIQVRTTPLMEADTSKRRVRHEARRISTDQSAIGDVSRSLREANEEIETRPIFLLMHTRIEEASDSTSNRLSKAQIGEDLVRYQARIARDLFAMADSLENEQGEEDEFERGSQAGGSGSSGGGSGEEDGVLPPIAELRLLRSLQVDVMESTRALDRGDLIDPVERSKELNRLSDLQSDLSELGQEMFDRHVGESIPDMGIEESLPPSFNRQIETTAPTPDQPAENRRQPRSLDELLGLDETTEYTIDPTPLPASHDPLEAIIEEMDRVAILIGQDLVTGPPTQRLQEDIIRRIDSLIDQAQEQQSSQSSSSQSSSSRQNSKDQQQSQSDQSGKQDEQSGSTSEAQAAAGSEERERTLPPEAQEVRLGGALEETGEEWGSLPSRVRDLLRQGRRDTYSGVYEKLTGEYYRRLAEQKNEP